MLATHFSYLTIRISSRRFYRSGRSQKVTLVLLNAVYIQTRSSDVIASLTSLAIRWSYSYLKTSMRKQIDVWWWHLQGHFVNV